MHQKLSPEEARQRRLNRLYTKGLTINQEMLDDGYSINEAIIYQLFRDFSLSEKISYEYSCEAYDGIPFVEKGMDISLNEIAKITRLSKNTVMNCVKKLINKKLIYKKPGIRGDTNRYFTVDTNIYPFRG